MDGTIAAPMKSTAWQVGTEAKDAAYQACDQTEMNPCTPLWKLIRPHTLQLMLRIAKATTTRKKQAKWTCDWFVERL